MYDNKPANDWTRRRRNDFARDRDDPPRERFPRRTDNFYGAHHSPKRRKLESGEIEAMSDFAHPRRPLYSSTYEHSAGRLPSQPFHPRDPHDIDRSRYPVDENWSRDPIGRREFSPTLRRRQEPLNIPPETKLDDLVDRGTEGFGRHERRLWMDMPDDRFSGRKRIRETTPPRFMVRNLEDRGEFTHPHPNNGRFAPSHEPYEYPSETTPSQKSPIPSSHDNALSESRDSPPQSPKEPGSGSSSDQEFGTNLSKSEIINQMDSMDSEISQVEEEIQRLRRIKSLDALQTDRSSMSFADQITASNQEIGAEHRRYMKLFQKTASGTKLKSDHVHVPDNADIHPIRRPLMLRHLKCKLLKEKRATRSLVEEYERKQSSWEKHLRAESIVPPQSVAGLNNAYPPSELPTEEVMPAPSARTSRSRSRSGAARSEVEFNQIMQQLNETERYDPNLRYLKTTVEVPDMIANDQAKQRSFVDSNRFTENCAEDYRNYLLVNPWSNSECDVFLKKYLLYPKQFGKIATFLPNKSIEEVIRYYYKNKHRLNLKELLEDVQLKKRSHRVRSNPKKPATGFINKELADLHADRNSNYWMVSQDRPGERVTRSQVQTTGATPPPGTPTQEVKMKPAVVMKPAVQKTKGRAKSPVRKATTTTKKSLTIFTAGVDQLCFSSNLPAAWSETEISHFRMALEVNGTDFKAIADFIGTKNHWQCRSFYYNFIKQLNLEQLLPQGSSLSSSSSTKPITKKRKPSDPKPPAKHEIRSSESFVKEVQHDQFAPKTLHLPLEPLAITHANIHNSEKVVQKGSIASLLNSPAIAAQEIITPKNWVLETPPSTAPAYTVPSFISLRGSSGSVPSAQQRDTSSYPPTSRHGSAPSSSFSSDLNIRHSFDSISSPLESSETKSSISWHMGDATLLRHSSADVPFHSYTSPKGFEPFNRHSTPFSNLSKGFTPVINTPHIDRNRPMDIGSSERPMSALSSAEKLDSSPTPAVSTPSPEVAPVMPSVSHAAAYSMTTLSVPTRVSSPPKDEIASTLTSMQSAVDSTEANRAVVTDDSDEEMLQIVTEEN